MKYIYIILTIVATLTFLSNTAYADYYNAQLYEYSIYGTFGDIIDPLHSNLPDSTYPFPQMRGGSFSGTFMYESLERPSIYDMERFAYQYVSIDIIDNTNTVVKNINTGPNGFLVRSDLIQFTFGTSYGIPYSIEDLRFTLNGTFTTYSNPWLAVPPSPSEIINGILNYGILETDGNKPFTYWDLPINQVTVIHTATDPYTHVWVPEPTSLILLALGLVVLVGGRRMLQK